MALLFKFSGLIILFSVSSLCGFLKSLSLKKRQKRLEDIYRSMSELGERIRIGAGDIKSITSLSFKENTLTLSDEGIRVSSEFLDKEDIELVNEFFADIGMSDAESECERLSIYMGMVDRRCEDARQKCNELCKLYNTLGILCGVFICIFFL